MRAGHRGADRAEHARREDPDTEHLEPDGLALREAPRESAEHERDQEPAEPLAELRRRRIAAQRRQYVRGRHGFVREMLRQAFQVSCPDDGEHAARRCRRGGLRGRRRRVRRVLAQARGHVAVALRDQCLEQRGRLFGELGERAGEHVALLQPLDRRFVDLAVVEHARDQAAA